MGLTRLIFHSGFSSELSGMSAKVVPRRAPPSGETQGQAQGTFLWFRVDNSPEDKCV